MVRIQLAPLNCNINSIVGKINPQRPRVKDCFTNLVRLVGNADVRAIFIYKPILLQVHWEKFLKIAFYKEGISFYS